MSSSLDTADFKTVWNDNFASGAGIESNIFPIKWGQSSEFSTGSGGVTLKSNGNAEGFMNSDQGGSQGFGYGLYQVTFTMPTNQASGAYVLLWPSTGSWPGPEIDLAEQYNHQSYLTVHWKGSNGGDGYHSYFYNANTSHSTTVSMDWESGSLTFYVNGSQVAQFKSGGSVPVPKDHADGGQNESFGAGNTGPAGTSITISDMSYSARNGASAPSAPSSPTAPSGPTPSKTIHISAPGTVHEASGSAGATVPITISDPGLSKVYALVMNSQNVAEENWISVPLNSSGSATQDFHFEHSGDYLLAVSDPTSQTDRGTSSKITLTSSAASPAAASAVSTTAISSGATTAVDVSSPGLKFVSSPAKGADAAITLSDPGLKEVYARVMSSSNVAEGNWIEIALNSKGQASHSFHFDQSGDYVLAASDPTSEAFKGVSAPIVISHS